MWRGVGGWGGIICDSLAAGPSSPRWPTRIERLRAGGRSSVDARNCVGSTLSSFCVSACLPLPFELTEPSSIGTGLVRVASRTGSGVTGLSTGASRAGVPRQTNRKGINQIKTLLHVFYRVPTSKTWRAGRSDSSLRSTYLA